MEIRNLRLKNKLGMHARAAAALVKVAQQFKAEIYLEHKGQTANGKSILGILTLACPQGGILTVKADGIDALKAVEALEILIENKFGED
ncbi:MAG: HPr family phosphocarrier protein [Smithellaceae bacterium]|jgi:phosphocarrier protein